MDEKTRDNVAENEIERMEDLGTLLKTSISVISQRRSICMIQAIMLSALNTVS